MKKGQLTSVEIDRKKVDVHYLGAGMFTKAYQIPSTEKVILFTKNDYMKELLLHVQGQNSHIPEIRHIETQENPNKNDETDIFVYEMPLYFPLKAESKVAWKQYKHLKNLRDDALQSLVYEERMYPKLMQSGYKIIDYITENCIYPEIRDALDAISTWTASYGEDIIFEFSPSNLSVDKEDRLILRDILLSMKMVRKMNKKRR